MSELIDDLFQRKSVKQEFNGKYYIAKPYDYYGWQTIIYRIKDAWRVLTGKSHAYHYKEDED